MSTVAPARRSPLARALLAVVAFYSRAISPALPPRCRFYPSCSAYAAEAIARHGAGRGSWLAVRRLVKCAPWHPGGVDLVPGTGAGGHSSSTTAEPATAGTPHRATRPATRRTPQEESSVA
ncbi:MAG: membrane protein insertion efficiency factor YidD [Blastococcus sp.]